MGASASSGRTATAGLSETLTAMAWVVKQQSVSVRLRSGDRVCAEVPRCSRSRIDQDTLTPFGFELLRNEGDQEPDGAAGAKRSDDANRLGRKRLRLRRADSRPCQGQRKNHRPEAGDASPHRAASGV